MSKPSCQWCGADLNHTFENNAGEPVLHLFFCQTSQWHNGPWHIGNQCRERCAEQMRRLRQVNQNTVTVKQLEQVERVAVLAIGDITPRSRIIAESVKVMIESVTEGG